MQPMTEAEIAEYIAWKHAEWARIDAMSLEELLQEFERKDGVERMKHIREWLAEGVPDFTTAGAFYDWFVDFGWYSDAFKSDNGFRPRSYTRQEMHDYMVRQMRKGVAYWARPS